jgi:hypothetical protein
VVLLLVAFLLNAPVRLAPEAFPALRRFLPLIQSYGSCASRVLFVEGQQPYGSRIDYGPLVHFYADREFEATDCAGAEAAIARAQPDWVIVSGANLTRCLSPMARAQLPTHVRYGNQHLLSRALPWKKDGVVDLTALERELRPAVDCRPAPISDSGYFRAE